ncbi:MAG: hypothetical protein ACK4K1_09380 [Flavobacterium sp.]
MKNISFHTLTTLFRISLCLFGFLVFGQTKATDFASTELSSEISMDISKEISSQPVYHFIESGEVLPDWDVSKEKDSEEILPEASFVWSEDILDGYDSSFTSGVFTRLFLSHQTPLYDLFCCWKFHLS